MLQETVRLLDSFLAAPYKIQNRLDSYKAQVDALAELMLRLDQQPVTLDYLTLSPDLSPYMSRCPAATMTAT